MFAKVWTQLSLRARRIKTKVCCFDSHWGAGSLWCENTHTHTHTLAQKATAAADGRPAHWNGGVCCLQSQMCSGVTGHRSICSESSLTHTPALGPVAAAGCRWLLLLPLGTKRQTALMPQVNSHTHLRLQVFALGCLYY